MYVRVSVANFLLSLSSLECSSDTSSWSKTFVSDNRAFCCFSSCTPHRYIYTLTHHSSITLLWQLTQYLLTHTCILSSSPFLPPSILISLPPIPFLPSFKLQPTIHPLPLPFSPPPPFTPAHCYFLHGGVNVLQLVFLSPHGRLETAESLRLCLVHKQLFLQSYHLSPVCMRLLLWTHGGEHWPDSIVFWSPSRVVEIEMPHLIIHSQNTTLVCMYMYVHAMALEGYYIHSCGRRKSYALDLDVYIHTVKHATDVMECNLFTANIYEQCTVHCTKPLRSTYLCTIGMLLCSSNL